MMWIIYLALAAAVFHLLHGIYSIFTDPLRDIPGPFSARFTKLWYLSNIYTGAHERHTIALHRKHAQSGEHFAPIVRLAPGMYSIKSPDKAVYGIGSKMPKNMWYEGWKHPSPDRWTVFTDRNIKRHAESRRVYAGLYAMSALLSYEAYVDDCADVFVRRLKEMAAGGGSSGYGTLVPVLRLRCHRRYHVWEALRVSGRGEGSGRYDGRAGSEYAVLDAGGGVCVAASLLVSHTGALS
ncbi:hypothetical protein PMIN07_011171 [Paraphaeosphaeria minitans]